MNMLPLSVGPQSHKPGTGGIFGGIFRHCPPQVRATFDVTEEERTDLIALLLQARADLERELRPAGYNVGINDGLAAGQTVHHLHIHLIPRYEGDRPDPRGGVRWVLPEKADYWSGK